MPATLPPQLHARLDDLAGRVRKLRTVRAMSRAALLIPAAAFVCVAADASFGLAAWARGLMFGGWLLLVAREVWNIRRARTATVDLEALASAVEAEFPRLAERLTTAVELAGRSDVSNGAPALIEEVIRDADTRARKLDLDSAFPAAATLGGFAFVLTMAVALAAPIALSPRGGEYARRFFAPWSSLAPAAHYRVIVTSGDPAVKRGSQVSLVAYVEPTKADAPLPELATLVVIAHGREERLEMTAGDDNFWHVRRPAEGDFDYRVEAGAATSDTYHVIAVDPVALSSARVTVRPPAYAVAASGPGVAVEGLGELAALEHSTVNFDFHFRPTPTSAILEFLPEGNGDDKPKKERHDLKVAADGSATISVPATSSGTFTLVAIGDRGVRTDFPPQPLRVHRDEPPKFPRVGGLGDKPRDVRPGEKIIIEWAAIDDVAVAKLEFEWRVNDGPARRTPLDTRGLGTPQAEGKYAFALKDRVKDGDALACRLIATDNRDVPAAKLGPQMTYFPGADAWAEFKISAAAEPLAEQDILRRKREIETKLQEIQREVKAEARAADKATAESREKKFPTPDQQEAMKTLLAEAKESAAKLDDLARDVAVTPDLGRLAEALRRVADREMKDAETALSRAADPAAASDRTKQLQKAGESLAAALKRMDELREQNEKAAKERLDKRALEDLAQDQHDLAETAKAADPKEAADLAQKQKELEERLKKLRAGSDAAKLATDAAKASEAEKLAAEARRAAADMRSLNEATKRDDKNDLSARLADLKKKQDALAKKARDLAAKTDTPSRAADTPPLKSDDAAKATDALENGDLDEAAKQQEKVRQDLERLANALEAASADSRDARGTARQLARLQEDLRQRLAQETKDTPLTKAPAERRAALEKQQEAIQRSARRLAVPEADVGARMAREGVVAAANKAREALKSGTTPTADKWMGETKRLLEQLADKLPTPEQRLARAKEELAKVKEQQETLRLHAADAVKAADAIDPDAGVARENLAKKLSEAAKRQAAFAEQIAALDAPGQDRRRDRTAGALQRAAQDLTEGRPQDVTASQLAAKRELDRFEQALNGQQTADEKVDELVKKQKALAADAAKNAKSPDKAVQADLLKRQGEVARELERLQTPEAAAALSDALDAAKKAEAADRDGKPDEVAAKATAAADKLQTLADRMADREPAAAAVDRLAKKQSESAGDLEKKRDIASTGEARRKAGQAAEELKNLRTGPDAQKAKKEAQDALQRAQAPTDIDRAAKAQREAADALKKLADQLARETLPKTPQPADPAEAADQLAKKQRDLADATQKAADAAKQKPGEDGKQAMREAMEKAAAGQRDLAKQAGEMPGRDAAKDRQQAAEAMALAEGELARENAEGAVKKQREAADALDRLSRASRAAQEKRAAETSPDLPNRDQAAAARQLAEEQKKLRDESMQAADDLAKENTRTDNPAEGIAQRQRAIAREAADLAKTVADRQGEKAEPTKQARQAADAAQQTSDQVRDGDLKRAKQSGHQAAEAMEQLAKAAPATESGQKAADLARRQADINAEMGKLGGDPGAAKAQQNARQQQLEDKAREIGKKLDELAKDAAPPGGPPSAGGEKMKAAAGSAKESGDQMQAAKQAGRKGQPGQAGTARGQAAEAMEKAAQQASEAAKQLGGADQAGSAQAGKSLQQAQDQMGQAGKELGQGKPGPAGSPMEGAAKSLQQAAGQLGQPGKPDGQSSGQQGNGGKNSGGNIGGPGGTVDLRQFSAEVAKHSGKSWGDLPGEVKTKVVQEMRARYGEDYARNIKLYFEQLAERK